MDSYEVTIGMFVMEANSPLEAAQILRDWLKPACDDDVDYVVDAPGGERVVITLEPAHG
jgi:hypothetical protein